MNLIKDIVTPDLLGAIIMILVMLPVAGYASYVEIKKDKKRKAEAIRKAKLQERAEMLARQQEEEYKRRVAANRLLSSGH